MEMAIARLELRKGSFRGAKTGPNPTDRGKLGTKRHILTDQRGTPLSAVITGAHVHDMKAAMDTVDGIVLERPSPRPYHRQHLCLDKGYDFPEIETGTIERRYVPHIRHRGEEKKKTHRKRRYKPKRWVVERSASWLNRFRKLLIRWEKKAENYLGLIQLACCITVYRRTILG
jgi:putative transposase